jgi:magnesium transporter
MVAYGGGCVSWYEINNPGDPQLDALAEQFHLHPLYIEDCRSGKERIKAEAAGNYLFLILKYAKSKEDGEFDLASIFLFVGRDFLITVSDTPDSSTGMLERARRAGGDEKPSRLLYLIVDTVVDSYFMTIDCSEDRIDKLEDAVFDDPAPEILEKIFDRKRELIELRRLLVNLRDAAMALQRDYGSIVEADLYPFFRDVYDHVLRLVDSVDTLRDLLNNTLDVYLSSVANRTNQVMKVLTILSTIALPALVISGVYGMNLKRLPLLDSDYGTEVVVGAMLLATAALLWLLRRYKWL